MRELRPAPAPATSAQTPDTQSQPASSKTGKHSTNTSGGSSKSQRGFSGGHQHTPLLNSSSSRSAGTSPCEHVVQFYDSDAYLYDAISAFLLTSFFSSQEAAIVVATAQHIMQLEHQLFHYHCLFPEVMKRRGQLITFEADVILDNLLAEGLTQQVFNAFITPIVDKLKEKGYGRVLVYGELVNLLCEQGRHWDALELEKIWNCFLTGPTGRRCGVELLCGYKLDVFALDDSELKFNGFNSESSGTLSGTDFQAAAFREICRTHSDVRPTEKAMKSTTTKGENYSGSARAIDMPPSLNSNPSGEQSLMIAVLEHRVRMLEKQALRIQEKEKELNRLVSKLPVGICAVYSSGKTTPMSTTTRHPDDSTIFSNASFAKLLGLDRSSGATDSTTSTWTAQKDWINNFVHPEDRLKLVRSIESVNEEMTECTYRVVQPDGELRWVLGRTVRNDGVSASDSHRQAGGDVGYIHSMTDLTEVLSSLRLLEAAHNSVRENSNVNQASSGDKYTPTPPPPPSHHKRRATDELRHRMSSSHTQYNKLEGNQFKHRQLQQPPSASSLAEPRAYALPKASQKNAPVAPHAQTSSTSIPNQLQDYIDRGFTTSYNPPTNEIQPPISHPQPLSLNSPLHPPLLWPPSQQDTHRGSRKLSGSGLGPESSGS